MTDIRSLPFPEALAWLRVNGEPDDPREDIDAASLARRFPRLVDVEIRDLTVPGTRGDLAARAYRSRGDVDSHAALVWVHGGAFIGGTLGMPESQWVAMELASRGIPVLALDYTKCLGDAHFPVPRDDVLAGWNYAVAHAHQLFGAVPDALFLGGASAGGTLTAASVAELVRAGGALPAGLISVYPALHPDGAQPGRIPDAGETGAQIALNYAGSADALADPRVFPGLGTGAGFPPTLVVVCERDALRPSGEAFAALLERAGVEVRLHLADGADHAHINEPADPSALPTIEAMMQWLLR